VDGAFIYFDDCDFDSRASYSGDKVIEMIKKVYLHAKRILQRHENFNC